MKAERDLRKEGSTVYADIMQGSLESYRDHLREREDWYSRIKETQINDKQKNGKK